jgi:segregation and condensation protein B
MTEPKPRNVFQRPLEAIAPEDRPAILGAMLHVAVEPVPLGVLAQQIGCTLDECRIAVSDLQARLEPVGLILQWTGDDEVQISTAPRFAPVIQRFLGLERITRLSQAALETLAIIAYRQPVTRADIESVRGVESSGVLQTLLARSLIEPLGRQATVGSPMLYGTSPEFLRFFGLSSLRDLPPLPDDLIVALEEAEEGEG